MLSWLPFALEVAVVAVAWCCALPADGMLLAPVQRWLRLRWPDLDARWWWKPLWGCAVCCSGQLALWGYALSATAYNPWHHLVTICAAMLLTAALQRFSQWTNN